jgi:hypothetical protein
MSLKDRREGYTGELSLWGGGMPRQAARNPRGYPSNWNCSLGIAAISTETLVVMMARWQLQRPLRTAAEPGPRPADSTSDTFDQADR